MSLSHVARAVVACLSLASACSAANGFTELFASGDSNDLDFTSLTLTPTNTPEGYTACIQHASQFLTDPSGGTSLILQDDDWTMVTLPLGQVVLFGTAYSNLYVGSNGYITFGTFDNQWVESVANHFGYPRVSALFDDLDPQAGGTVSWRQLPDRVAVTFQNVPESSAGNANSFQIELFFDGRIRITWLGIAASDGLAGLSAGQGVPLSFQETDISGLGACERFTLLNIASPAPNSPSAPTNTVVQLDFSEGLVTSTVNSATYRVYGSQGGFYSGTYAHSLPIYGDFQVSGSYLPGERVSVMLTSGILSTNARVLNPHQFQFTIAASGCTNYALYDSGQELNYANQSPQALLAGDLDGDDDVDLLLIARNYGYVAYLNNGAGVYTEGWLAGQLGDEEAAELGDLDADGDLDFIVVRGAGGANVVYLNNGDATFSNSGQALGSDSSTSVAIGDVDGDGDLDHVVGNNLQPARIYLNQGGAVFASGQSLGTTNNDTRAVALGDLDRDGDLDLVVANATAQSMVCYNSGNGVFTTNQVLTLTNATSLALGDLDANGFLDLVVGRNQGTPGEVYLNNGTSPFVFHQFLSGTEVEDVELGDFDGDADLDIVTADLNQQNQILANDGSGTFSSGRSISLSASLLAVCDMDRDGDLDATGASATAAIRILFNIGCPVSADDDGDGIPTSVELANGLNPLLASDATSDNDGDKQTAWQEYVAGTQMTNGASYFKVAETLRDSGLLRFTYGTVSGRVYRLQYRSDLLTAPDWATFETYTSAFTAVASSTMPVSNRINVRVSVSLPP